MTFTYVTVTRNYDNPDGTDPAGYLTFVPTTPMVNGGVTIAAVPVRVNLDVDGLVSINLAACTDPDTEPTTATYLVTEKIVGQTARAYYVAIPHDVGPTVDLGELDALDAVPPRAAALAAHIGDNDPHPGLGLTFEQVRDTIGTTVVAGGGIDVTVDDPGNTVAVSIEYLLDGVGDGATDDTAAINAQLAAVTVPTVLRGRPGANYKITTPLIIRSNTTLDMTGCTITLAAGSNCALLQNSAYRVTARGVVDVVTTDNSTTITSATAAFVGGDVGKRVIVYGAGDPDGDLDTTIASVTNGTTVVLADAPGWTATGLYASIGPRDTNITVIGGTWDKGANVGSDLLHVRSGLCFVRADKVTVRDVTYTSTAGKYGVYLADATDFVVRDTRFNAASDGVHINGPARSGLVDGVSGTCGDDVLAFLEQEGFAQYDETRGRGYDITFRGNRAESGTTGCKLTASGAVTLGPESDVIVEDCTGGVRMLGELVAGGVFGSVRLIGCTGNVGLLGENAEAFTVRDLTIVGHRFDAGAASNFRGIDIRSDTTVDSLTIDSISVRATGNQAAIVAVDGATAVVDRVAFTNADLRSTGTDARGVMVVNGGTLRHLSMTGLRMNNPGTGVTVTADAGTTVNTLTATGCRIDQFAFIQLDNTGPTSVTVNGCTSTGYGLIGDAAVNLYGAGIPEGQPPWVTAGNGTITPYAPDWQVDVEKVVAAAGAMAFNTNSGLSCGTGPVIYTGSAWVPLDGDGVYQPDMQVIVLTEAPYSADNTGVTAIDTALTAAIAVLETDGSADPTGASARHGGVIYLPPGYYRLAAAHTIAKNSVVIRGAGRQATKLFCDAAFPTSTAVFNITGTTTVFDSRLESLTLNCNGVAGSIGVKTLNAQEGCGLRGVRVRDFKGYGFWAVGTGQSAKPAELVIRDCEFWASSAMATGYGLYFDDCSQSLYLSDTTILTLAASSGGTAAVYLTKATLHARNVHIEDFPDGFYVDTDAVLVAASVTSVNGPGGSAAQATVHLANTTNRATLKSINNGTGNILYDARSGMTRGGASLRTLPSYIVDYSNDNVVVSYSGAADFRKTRGGTAPAIFAKDGTSSASTSSLQQWANSSSSVQAEMMANGLFRLGLAANTTTNWSDGHLQLGPHHVFVDDAGHLRVKSSAPGSATDGALIPTAKYCHIYQSGTSQTSTNGSEVTIDFTTTLLNDDTAYYTVDLVTNNSITVLTAGVYGIAFGVKFQGGSAGERVAILRDQSGASNLAESGQGLYDTAAATPTMTGYAMRRLAANTRLGVRAYADGGTNAATVSNTSPGNTFLAITFLGA